MQTGTYEVETHDQVDHIDQADHIDQVVYQVDTLTKWTTEKFIWGRTPNIISQMIYRKGFQIPSCEHNVE